MLAYEVTPDSVAAVIAEPVLGEGGFIAPPPEFFKEVMAICREHSILFIADEIQTGIGRTGAMFACERYGIEPDIVVTSKSIGGGLPIAAVTGRAEIMDTPNLGGLGGTYNGNPVACAAALAVLDMAESEQLSQRAEELGERFLEQANSWRARWPLIGEVHGLGAMRALELVTNPDSREPATADAAAIVRYCYEHGVIVISAGRYANIIRLLMPLVITDDQFEEGMTVLESAIGQVAEGAMGYAAAQTRQG
jgi:4-aminobutyrate aminotransferase/(S)-3-amino-2-methylpropionate transaminase